MIDRNGQIKPFRQEMIEFCGLFSNCLSNQHRCRVLGLAHHNMVSSTVSFKSEGVRKFLHVEAFILRSHPGLINFTGVCNL